MINFDGPVQKVTKLFDLSIVSDTFGLFANVDHVEGNGCLIRYFFNEIMNSVLSSTGFFFKSTYFLKVHIFKLFFLHRYTNNTPGSDILFSGSLTLPSSTATVHPSLSNHCHKERQCHSELVKGHVTSYTTLLFIVVFSLIKSFW